MPKTILLIDDEEHMIRLLQFALRPVGAHFAAVKSGQAALLYLESHPSVEAIILDYSMPDQNGVETLRQIRALEKGANIPVVMLTARDQTLIRKDAEGLQVHSFMTKPFSPSVLQQTLLRILTPTSPIP
jgi:CheY-like chemotaxis protein